MSEPVYTETDLGDIALGSADFNRCKQQLDGQVKGALGFIRIEDGSIRNNQVVMECTEKGIRWEVKREGTGVYAQAFRLRASVEDQQIYDSKLDKRIPFYEFDSLRWTLPAFITKLVRNFPEIHLELQYLRSAGARIRSQSVRRHFLLSKKGDLPGRYGYPSLVVAESAEMAVQKLGLQETSQHDTDGEIFRDLKDAKGYEYLLESISEITERIES